MIEMKALRIYMPLSAKVPRHKLTFWKWIFEPSLSPYILRQAKQFGIEQAVSLRVTAGYLKGRKLTADIGEVPPPDLPVCLELIDSEKKLISFFKEYSEELSGCRVALFVAAEFIS